MKWPLSRIVIGALIVVVIAGAGAVGAMKWFWPGAGDRRPKLVDVPPLSPVTRNSVIVTPVAIALTAIQDALEAAAPRDYSGKPSIPTTPFLSNVDIGWSVARGPFVVAGRPDGTCHLHHAQRIAPCRQPDDEPRGGARRTPPVVRRLAASRAHPGAFRVRRAVSSGPLAASLVHPECIRARAAARPGTGRAEPDRKDGRAARRYQRQRDADSASHAAAGVAIGPQSRGAGHDRGRLAIAHGHEVQPGRRGETVARPHCQ